MPQPLQYRTGSLIYFQGDQGDRVFLLQTGTVSLVYQDIETGGDVHDMVSPGEFFGVKSALGRFPREENALVLQDSTIMAFSVPEFENLAMKNIRIVMKILKVFSNQLRRIHRQVSLLTDTNEESPEAGLFKVGNYYFKNRRYFLAHSVFNRYLTYYPSGQNAVQAAKNLEIAESALKQRGKSQRSAAPPGRADDSSAGQDVHKVFYDAVSLISQEKYQNAYQLLKTIVEEGRNPEYAAKSAYEMGRCLYLLGKFEDCIKYFTGLIGQYPKHPGLGDMLFFMGQSHEKCGRKDMASAYYKKVVAMIAGEDNEIRIKARKALQEMGA